MGEDFITTHHPEARESPAMGEDLVTTLSMENSDGGDQHGPCTLLSMDPSGHLNGRAVGVMVQPHIGGGPAGAPARYDRPPSMLRAAARHSEQRVPRGLTCACTPPPSMGQGRREKGDQR